MSAAALRTDVARGPDIGLCRTLDTTLISGANLLVHGGLEGDVYTVDPLMAMLSPNRPGPLFSNVLSWCGSGLDTL